jgi:hypothetical protein
MEQILTVFLMASRSTGANFIDSLRKTLEFRTKNAKNKPPSKNSSKHFKMQAFDTLFTLKFQMQKIAKPPQNSQVIKFNFKQTRDFSTPFPSKNTLKFLF